MSDKQTVLEFVSRLPEDSTLADINEELATLAAIRRGAEAADQGRVQSQEEVKRLVRQWASP